VVLQSGWGNRTARRVKNIEISTSVGENSPPAGKYLVEDKFGLNAFGSDDTAQAIGYSNALESGGGKGILLLKMAKSTMGLSISAIPTRLPIRF
jgi:hypothetical protein